MTVNPNVTGREHDLEDALRGMCNHLTKIQCRAAEYLPNGDANAFIDDVLGLLDGRPAPGAEPGAGAAQRALQAYPAAEPD